jgi:hypothetical protein
MPILSDPLGWFTLQFPEGWTQSTEDCVTTLRSPRDVGIVYVSGGRHAGGRRAGFGGASFLLRFLEHIGVAADEAAIEDGQGIGCRTYSYRGVSGGRYWRYWSITDDETALLISYTCASERSEEEEAAVLGMVRSVRLYASGEMS